jgi:inhibitor of cysteine peptidase
MGGQMQKTKIEVNAGDTFTLSLRSNPSTGNVWKLKELDTSMLTFINNKTLNNSPDVEGAQVTEVWEFKALKSGDTSIAMIHDHFGNDYGPTEYFKVTIY